MPLAEQPDAPAGVAPVRARLSAWLRAPRNMSVRWLRAGALGRRRAAASDPAEAPPAATLERVIADLDRLNHSTERDFLTIGEKLIGFTETVKLITSELSVLADLLSGERGVRAAEALTSALDRTREMGERAEGCASLLGGMRQEAARVTETLSGFKDTLSIFHIIGVLTRIETAHLGSAGADFGNLADDVKSLAGDIQAKIESSLDTAAELISPIQSALDRVSAIEEGEAKDLPLAIAGVLAGLAAFRDMQNRTHGASVRLASQYRAVSDAFNELIVSVQFHDITRQQVEHVIEALRRLVPAFAGAGGITRGHGDPLAVVALQSMQLADAGEKFAASVAAVAHNLDRIAGHVLEMAGESRTLSGLSEDAKDSFFLEMERACTAILASLGGRGDAETAARAASGSMAETVGRMHASLEEIGIIEIQIQRMALNASIRSAHIGAAGDALGVLAGSMQQLAVESKQRSESLVQALGVMSEAASRLAGPGAPALSAGRGASEDCSEKMRAAVADLHSSSECSFAQAAQVAARSERLREDLSAARNGFSAGALFAEAIGRARDMLQEIGGGERFGAPLDGADRGERALADLAKHYTMQAERDVHEGVTRAAAGEAPMAASGEPRFPSGEASELGENVELF